MKICKKITKAQAFILSAVLVIAASICVGIGIITTNGKSVRASAGNDEPYKLTVMMFGQPAFTGPLKAGETEVSRSITATILPETATNKKVDWEVIWGGNQRGEVADYITVTPESDGGVNATVTCKNAFDGEILIVCTTRSGNKTASCTVTFAGCPTEMEFSGYTPDEEDKSVYGVGGNYEYDVVLSNPFNEIGEKFNNFTVSVTGVGKIEVGSMEHYNQSGNDYWYENSFKAVDIDPLKDNFLTATYSNGKLRISVLQEIESYYLKSQRIDGGRTTAYTEKFHAFVGECYFTITVTETLSGVSKTVKAIIDPSAVVSVELNNDLLEF